MRTNMFTIEGEAVPVIENIRGLNLVAVRLTAV
jgi:hypothetical protein